MGKRTTYTQQERDFIARMKDHGYRWTDILDTFNAVFSSERTMASLRNAYYPYTDLRPIIRNHTPPGTQWRRYLSGADGRDPSSFRSNRSNVDQSQAWGLWTPSAANVDPTMIPNYTLHNPILEPLPPSQPPSQTQPSSHTFLPPPGASITASGTASSTTSDPRIGYPVLVQPPSVDYSTLALPDANAPYLTWDALPPPIMTNEPTTATTATVGNWDLSASPYPGWPSQGDGGMVGVVGMEGTQDPVDSYWPPNEWMGWDVTENDP
ncbi:MAG: hypothetical protein M1823_004248 [Watsoniomyces obsoletus]|nr:MAG: hypothetical protein M1823_004248 [Watsoniomyces obsoletus]